MTFEEAIERVPFLRALDTPDRERLRPYVESRRLSRSGRVWSQGTRPPPFGFVVRGRLKLFKTSEAGRETIVELCGPGALLSPGRPGGGQKDWRGAGMPQPGSATWLMTPVIPAAG